MVAPIDIAAHVIHPDDPAYDDARAVFNAMIDRRPLAIVQCRNALDVAAGIRYARDHDLVLSVRSGGHGVAGHAVCDGGIYVNNLGTEGPERVRSAYGPNHARLAALKPTYDPANVFRLNQNVPPR